MGQRPAVDPSRLDGEALRRWYSRTPQEIEQERRAIAAARYADYFGASAHLPVGSPAGVLLTGSDQRQAQRMSGSARLASTSSHPTSGKADASKGKDVEGVRADRPVRPDPYRTEVFQPGPDGKLHPIPGWHTTGPDDFGAWSHNVNWGGVAKDLTWIGSNALAFMDGAGLVEGLVSTVGPKLGLGAIKSRLIHGHHADPKFMGGRPDQELVEMVASFHSKLHQRLIAELRKAGFPPQGGTTGRRVDWENFFSANPGTRERAVEILRRTTRDFDIEHGTSLLPYLEKELRLVTPKAPPARMTPPAPPRP